MTRSNIYLVETSRLFVPANSHLLRATFSSLDGNQLPKQWFIYFHIGLKGMVGSERKNKGQVGS